MSSWLDSSSAIGSVFLKGRADYYYKSRILEDSADSVKESIWAIVLDL